ncbi:MAG: sigma-70 family RNA polymerase sigma factor, partial [Microcoleus sp. Co-bin12]|nr:sigma-70 family RNA polymerase sigma factor [Microcoleus sp. Co-bin12]
PAQVKALLQKGYQSLESNLPEDIRAIYLDENLDYQEELV